MRKKLEITLQSDLCAGVGKHFAAMIDLDTAVDEYGIPYIPSRRLKGCMKEAAEFIGIENIDAVFGKKGDSKAGSLHITDAKINNYNKTISELNGYRFNVNEVTDLFCSVRGETAIDDETGIAKDGSLRYIRVVNRLAPDSNENMKFYSIIEYNDKFDTDISKIVSALRNIGYHRNRGLGAVTCRLTNPNDSFSFNNFDFDDNKEYEIKYTVYLESDLMLPAGDANHSLDYISGTMALGAFASKYVRKYGDKDFNDIFYSNDVKFSNLYISKYDAANSRYIDFKPAGRFLAKIKAAKEDEQGIHNTIGVDLKEKQYKPLKKGYVNYEYGYTEPEQKIVYHNAVNSTDNGLYMQYCLCSNQYFSGTITGKGNKIAKIYELFSDGEINFGRSKTAQYSTCTIKKIDVKVAHIKDIGAEKGSVGALVLESDAALVNEDGIFTTELDALLSQLNLAADDIREETSIATKVVSGYNAKWNHKKPQFPVFSAGSSIVFNVESDKPFKEYISIGEKLNEGFGKVCFIKNADELNIDSKEIVHSCTEQSRIINELENSRFNSELIGKAIDKADSIGLAASQVGRVMLMCKESKSFEDFSERINSIKNASVKEENKVNFSKNAFDFELSSDADWKTIQKHVITALTVRKYNLKKEKKDDE